MVDEAVAGALREAGAAGEDARGAADAAAAAAQHEADGWAQTAQDQAANAASSGQAAAQAFVDWVGTHLFL